MAASVLHRAAYEGDVLAVHELLTWGAAADRADSSGITPLCLAVFRLALASSPHLTNFCSADRSLVNAAELKREIARLKSVIHILVEQHVQLNTSINDEPLIYFLCRSKAWETVGQQCIQGTGCSTNSPSRMDWTKLYTEIRQTDSCSSQGH